MADVKVLDRKRGTVRSKITRLANYIQDEDIQYDLIVIDSKIKYLEAAKDSIEELRTGYHEILKDKDLPATEEILDGMEVELEDLEVRLLKFKSSLKNTTLPVCNEANVKVKLPDIPLPKFSGNIEDWNNFKVQFDSLISQNDKLNASHKLFYLQSALTGNARQIQTSEDTFDSLFKALQERYEHKRLLVNTHITELLNLDKVHHESAIDLRCLLDKLIKHVRALKSLNLNLDKLSANIIINIVLQKIDKESRKLYEMSLKTSDLPEYDDLVEFLNLRCQFLENLQRHAVHMKPKTVVTARNLFVNSNSNVTACMCCKSQSHSIYKCSEFLKLNTRQRFGLVKKHYLCINCFSPSHKLINCKSKYRCKFCSKQHNSLLHDISKHEENKNKNTPNPDFVDVTNTEQKISIESDAPDKPSGALCCSMSSSHYKTSNVILATVVIYARNSSGNKYPLRCLLDSGSMVNAICKESADFLRLRRESVNMPISGLNGTFIPVKSKVLMEISNSSNDFVRLSEFVIVPKITNITPTRHININFGKLGQNIKFADPAFFKPGRIDALIGAELFFDMMKSGKIYLEDSRLVFQETVFGYIVSGSTMSANSSANAYCGLLREGNSIDKTLREFWEIEEVGESTPVLSSEEIECERHFLNTHSREPNGRYIVKMPLKTDKVLGESKIMASNRLESLWKRLRRDPRMQSLYLNFIQEYRDLGHMQEVSEDRDSDVSYYLPHHGVFRPDKSSTKLRVVFNGSALTTTGVSLNQLQMTGKIPQQDLFSIMLRFRKHVYAFVADIRMMYRQILIHPTQRDLQRIIWKEGPTEPVKSYKLCTVTYGTKSAPYLATRALKQLCDDEEKLFPEAAAVAREDFYVDDIVTGSNDLETTRNLQFQLIQLLERGGMTLHKWTSNDVGLLNSNSSSEHNIYSFDGSDQMKSVKALGMLWKPHTDCFSYKVTIQRQSTYTKRSVLSDISRIFDPLGLIGPVISRAKLFMQNLWLLHLDWNDPLPEAFQRKWLEFVYLLPRIENISIPRYFLNNDNIIIHGFSDASKLAYGAVIYAQCMSSDGTVSVHLLCSKSRVAPIKPVTIPRLELCAAFLLSQLTLKVIRALKLEGCSTVLWSDSTIVLAWLKKPPNELKTFVSNRVSTIQELTKDFQWRHVTSNNNPADLVSRGLAPDQIQNQDLWWRGPSFLMESMELPEDSTLGPATDTTEYTCELKQPVDISLTSVLDNTVLTHIVSCTNSYVKLIRVLSFVFRFMYNCKRRPSALSGPLTSQELQHAENILLRWVQETEFCKDYKCLREGKPLSVRSPLKSLNPFCSDNDILRVGGRLQNAKIRFDQKHQIILPAKNKVTYLIFEGFHKKYLHIGPQTLLYHMRQKFWPINGRNLARKVVHNCVSCVKNKPVTVEQLMGNPPPERVNISSPFSNTGVDFAGPFFVKNKNQRKGPLHKVYVAIFVCMATKAIHIELVSDLTSEAFISTLKRFFARRGKCCTLFSDNATNFVGAQSELKKLHNLATHPDEVLGNFLAADRINWKFIPPGAPNFGGLWEAGVKSFKHHLKRVVGNANLNYEEFNTAITEIEGILNSRPLTPISSDINDFEALTPGHFLIGRPIITIASPDITNVPVNRLSRWQRVEKLTQLIWKKWSFDYLSHFQQRHKWKVLKNDVKPGMMVILKEDNLPKCKWALGRITEVIHGRDGCIRVVNVRTAHGVIKRPITKLCILPIDTNN